MVSDAKADPDARQALHLLIDGRVQGVGYRYALAAEAQAIGLFGWVRNLTDGRVEVFAQGPRDALDKLVAWARAGPGPGDQCHASAGGA